MYLIVEGYKRHSFVHFVLPGNDKIFIDCIAHRKKEYRRNIMHHSAPHTVCKNRGLLTANCKLPTEKLPTAMGYDTVSFFYDALARLVFGDAQLKAQASTLHFIKPGDSVLIVGGGSGWILDAINKINSSGLSITYVDSSAKMIAHAKYRNVPGSIVYHVAAIADMQLQPGAFDVVITPFLFDNFAQQECDNAFQLLHHSLAHKGIWLFTDFRQTGRLGHRLLLRSMYVFFGLLAGIKARNLPDTDGLFSMADYKLLDEYRFMKGFIVSSVFEKVE